MMNILGRALVCLGLAVMWGEGDIAFAERPSHHTVEFIETVYFPTVEESDVALNPGAYDVEVAETWLRVFPLQQGTRAEAPLIEDEELAH